MRSSRRAVAMTSSILRIRVATSAAVATDWTLTLKGSTTPADHASNVPPVATSTPWSRRPAACAARTAVTASSGSRPAFSASARGISSSAAANAS